MQQKAMLVELDWNALLVQGKNMRRTVVISSMFRLNLHCEPLQPLLRVASLLERTILFRLGENPILSSHGCLSLHVAPIMRCDLRV